MSDNPLAVWKERLEFLLVEEAKTADPLARFALKKRIEEARERILELEGFAGLDAARAADIERAYLGWIMGEMRAIGARWHASPIVPTAAHTRKGLGWRAGWRAILHRYSTSDYARTPGLGDLDLTLRAGFGKRTRIRDLARELRKYSKIVVLGDPGSGKSVCLRQLVHDLAERALQRGGRPLTLPVFVPMDTYQLWRDESGREPEPVIELLARSLREQKAVRDAPRTHPALYVAAHLEALLHEGRVACVFDALDEMPQDSYQERYQALKRFMVNWEGINPKNRFIYSCRSLDYDPAFNVDEVIIDPFDRGRIRRFLRQHLPEDLAEDLYRQIVDDEAIEEIVGSPFFLQALAYINKPGPGAAGRAFLPRTRGTLLQAFVEAVLAREAEGKQDEELAAAGGREALLRFLCDLAFAIQERPAGGTSAERDALGEVWARHAGWRELLRIAQRARFLGKREAGAGEHEPLGAEPPERIEFVHHRLQEFFAARQLAQQAQEAGAAAAPALERYFEDIWWQETVVLALGLLADPRPVFEHLLRARPETAGFVSTALRQAREPIPKDAVRPEPTP